MSLTDLVPWARNRSVATQKYSEEGDPFLALHREMNRIFDNFARGFNFGPPTRVSNSGGWPNVEVRETDKEVVLRDNQGEKPATIWMRIWRRGSVTFGAARLGAQEVFLKFFELFLSRSVNQLAF